MINGLQKLDPSVDLQNPWVRFTGSIYGFGTGSIYGFAKPVNQTRGFWRSTESKTGPKPARRGHKKTKNLSDCWSLFFVIYMGNLFK